VAHGEIHLELSVDYADDDKVRALAAYGRRARATRDLYVQMLCYCKRKMTDGKIPAEQVGVLVYPDSLKDGLRDAQALIAVGLLEETDGGYYLPGYLRRNKSRQQIADAAAAKRAGAMLANHNRWHDDRIDPRCPHCTDQSSVATPIAIAIGGLKRSDSTESESESESKTESETETRRRATPPPAKFEITPELRAWGRERAPFVADPEAETEQFLDYHRAKGTTFKDWTAAWRKWMAKASEYAADRGRTLAPTGTDPHDEWGFS
jgi:hypothetical protein